ncbi:MAG: RNA polymerase sigma factor [Candidatus Eisenbacteria bacterium]
MSESGEDSPSGPDGKDGPSIDDPRFVARLRRGDAAAFARLVDELNGRMLALARSFCSRPEIAQEAVQDTWMAVIRGLGGFEGRAPLRSWIFSILVRRARTVAVRESRHQGQIEIDAGFSRGMDGRDREPGIGDRGRWQIRPAPWGFEDPEAAMLTREALGMVESALGRLPEAQRAAVLLRDVEGLDTQEACNILDVSETNLRVLLFRGRSLIRRALDDYGRSKPAVPGRRRVTP